MTEQERRIISRKHIAMILLAGCIAGGFAVYRGFVDEQKCLAYEREFKLNLNELLRVTIDVDVATEQVETKPHTAPSASSLIDTSSKKVDAIDSRIDIVKSAYASNCGLRRAETFVKTPQVTNILSRTEFYRISISERAKYFRSQGIF